MAANLFAQQVPHFAQMGAGNRQSPRQRLLARRQDQGVTALPRQATDLAVRHIAAVGPNAVAIEAALDARGQRQQVPVVGEHHRHAEQRRDRPGHAIRRNQQDHAEHDADREVDGEERRLGRRPRQHDVAPQAPPGKQLVADPQVDDDEERTQRDEGLPQRAGKLLGAHRASALVAAVSSAFAASSARDNVGSKHCRQRAS